MDQGNLQLQIMPLADDRVLHAAPRLPDRLQREIRKVKGGHIQWYSLDRDEMVARLQAGGNPHHILYVDIPIRIETLRLS